MVEEPDYSLTNQPNRSKFITIIASNWALIFIFILLVIFSFTGTGFFSLDNFQNIIHLSTIYILLASAETFVIITSGIDLSIGFIMGLSSVLSATIMRDMNAASISQTTSILVGSIVALIVSLIPGLINGILIAWYKVPPFITTLGMWGITNGIALKICQGFPISHLPSRLVLIGNGYLIYAFPGKGISLFHRPAGIAPSQIKQLIRFFPNSLIFVIVVLFVLWHILRNTKFGRHTYAIGDNMDASIRAGINVSKHLIIIYILSSFLAGLAGVFNVFQTGVGNFTPSNAMYSFTAIAAVVIGGASLMGGKGSIIGSLIGVFLLNVMQNGLQISGIEPFYRFIAVGLILIVAVIIDQLFPDLF